MPALNGFISDYINVTDLIPNAHAETIWQAVHWEKHNIRLDWFGTFELTISYNYESPFTDEFYAVPAVEGRGWNAINLGAVATPYVEPDIVLRASGEFLPFVDEWGWQLWVRDEFLRSPRGQELGTALFRAKLALNLDDAI